jgi:hypothetical protein
VEAEHLRVHEFTKPVFVWLHAFAGDVQRESVHTGGGGLPPPPFPLPPLLHVPPHPPLFGFKFPHPEPDGVFDEPPYEYPSTAKTIELRKIHIVTTVKTQNVYFLIDRVCVKVMR